MNVKRILRPIKKSSLKLKKKHHIHVEVSEAKGRWGMHSNITVLKLKSIESELAKKMHFLTLLFN